MREILFRGKRLDNGEWIEGWYEMYPFGWWPLKASIISAEDAISGCYQHNEVDPSTVGQYTGLLDKNGKRIFEGDVIKQKTTTKFAEVSSFKWECYGVVRFGYYDWDEGNAGYSSVGWYIEPLKSVAIEPKNYLVGAMQPGLNEHDIINEYHPMEVIGNIHDNPELLEGGQDNG